MGKQMGVYGQHGDQWNLLMVSEKFETEEQAMENFSTDRRDALAYSVEVVTGDNLPKTVGRFEFATMIDPAVVKDRESVEEALAYAKAGVPKALLVEPSGRAELAEALHFAADGVLKDLDGAAKAYLAKHGNGLASSPETITTYGKLVAGRLSVFGVLVDRGLHPVEEMRQAMAAVEPESRGFVAMKAGPQIVAEYVREKKIDTAEFSEWFRSGGFPEEDANHHTSRYMELLENFVEERDADRAAMAVQYAEPVFVKDAVSFGQVLNGLANGFSPSVMLRLDPAGKIEADERLMKMASGASAADLVSLYEATKAARDGKVGAALPGEVERERYDGLEFGRRFLGARLVEAGVFERLQVIAEGVPLVSERTRAMQPAARFDRHDHMQDGRSSEVDIRAAESGKIVEAVARVR